jgi:hypothetical protein
MKKKFFLFALLFGAVTASFAQKTSEPNPEFDKGALGLGLGFDYGGIGINYTVYPQKNIGLFGGVGYAIAGVGYNFGARFQVTPVRQFTPFAMIMYGYNAAIQVKDANGPGQNSNKLFYGPTAGVGFDLGWHRAGKGYLSIALTIPFRSPDVNNYINELSASGVTFANKPSPVGFSIGYKIVSF